MTDGKINHDLDVSKMKSRRVGIVVLIALMIGLALFVKSYRNDSVKQVSLVKHLYFELYASEEAPELVSSHDFQNSKTLSSVPNRIQKAFLNDLHNGSFTYKSKGVVQDGQFIMIWSCKDYRITCSEDGGVKLEEK